MIGNDIVDLTLAKKESNWKRKGFLDKIFTKQEQLFINTSENQEIMIWNLWTRKEAAYKIYNRETEIRKFNPIQFECFDWDEKIGKVVFENQVYFTKTEITTSYIYSIAVSEIKYFDEVLTLENSIKIEKKNGIPFYINDNQYIKIISKTHHGQFEKIISIN